jgi:hypothetical protein
MKAKKKEDAAKGSVCSISSAFQSADQLHIFLNSEDRVLALAMRIDRRTNTRPCCPRAWFWKQSIILAHFSTIVDSGLDFQSVTNIVLTHILSSF